MYPLLETTMESLNDQLCEMQDPSQVTYSAETRYTSLVLLEAVKASLEKAKPKATPEATDATNAPAASPNVPKADINPAAEGSCAVHKLVLSVKGVHALPACTPLCVLL